MAAPGKITRPPGERIKNDRTDALRLARLLRLGELTPVDVPTPATRDGMMARLIKAGSILSIKSSQ